MRSNRENAGRRLVPGTLLNALNDYLIVIAILALVLVTALVEPRTISPQNLRNIVSQFGVMCIIALGLTVPLVGGFVDLSVAGIINVVAIVTVKLIDVAGQFPALFLGLAFGALLGLFNSALILKAGATTLYEALFISYGMSAVYSALALILCGGETQQMFALTRDSSFIREIGSGRVGILTIPVILFFAFLVILHIFQSRTLAGRSIALIGGNKTAAELSGIRVNRAIGTMFMISGFMAALGAIILFTRIGKSSPTIGAGYDTNALLAVVVGGTTMKGGKGGVLRTLLGVILITLMSNCLDMLGTSSYLKVVLSGVILVAAIWLDNRKERGGERR